MKPLLVSLASPKDSASEGLTFQVPVCFLGLISCHFLLLLFPTPPAFLARLIYSLVLKQKNY